MKARRILITGIGAAAVIVAAAMVLNHLPGPNVESVARPAATASAKPNQPVAPGGSASSASPDPATSPSTAPDRKSAKTAPPPKVTSPRQDGTEARSPGTTSAKGLPKSKRLPALLTTPLPASASAANRVVKGFPREILPQAPHSVVANSSVASEGVHLQAGLTARTSLTAQEVVAFYRTALAKYGMYDSAAPALAGTEAVTFTRDNNAVALSIKDVSGGSSYVIFATFTASTKK